MLEQTVTIQQLPQAWLTQIQKNKKNVVLALRKTAREAKIIAKTVSPTDQYLFQRAWKVINTPEGALLINDAPHADIIEFGSRPHWPPPKPIREWLIRKIRVIGIDRMGRGENAPLMTKTGKARGVRHDYKGAVRDADQRVIDQLTYLICRKISREGTKPHHILTDRQIEFALIMKNNIIEYLTRGG